MKLTAEQKANRDNNMINTLSLKKDVNQILLQKFIDSHYPIKEKFIIVESKLNSPDQSGFFIGKKILK